MELGLNKGTLAIVASAVTLIGGSLLGINNSAQSQLIDVRENTVTQEQAADFVNQSELDGYVLTTELDARNLASLADLTIAKATLETAMTNLQASLTSITSTLATKASLGEVSTALAAAQTSIAQIRADIAKLWQYYYYYLP